MSSKPGHMARNIAGYMSLKSFAIGLGLGLVAYLVLFVWIYSASDTTEETQIKKLSSQTVLVIRPAGFNAAITEMSEQNPDVNADSVTPEDESNLYKSTEYGSLPIVNPSTGMTVFKTYKRNFDRSKMVNNSVISLVIMDLGLSDSATETAIKTMPPDVTFALSPYTNGLDFWIEQARGHGHEIWLTLPVEPDDYPESDTGPQTLLTNLPERENYERINWLMSRSKKYVGFVSEKSNRFMHAINDMRPVVGTIYKHGLGFVDTGDIPSDAAQSMAVGMGAPYAHADIWIDVPETQANIKESLKKLEDLALKNGQAIGLFHPYPVSYQEVVRWAETLPEKNIILAPLSAQAAF